VRRRAPDDAEPATTCEPCDAGSAWVGNSVAASQRRRRQLGRDSRNSSLPPSRGSPAARAKRPKKDSGRKQGGQPGHPGSHRELLADPDHVVEHWPDACGGCGAPITVEDRDAVGDAVGHQVSDIVVRVDVTELRIIRRPA